MDAPEAVYTTLRTVLPFEWSRPAFMIHALLIVALLAPLCAALGVQVVNFRLAFFSDAVSHSAFTGVVLGYLLVPVFTAAYPAVPHWDRILPPITLVLFGLLVGTGITLVRRRTDLSSDTVIGVFFAAVIATGIAVLSRLNLRADFERYLYGSIVTAGWADVCIVAALAAAAAVYLAATFNSLLLFGLHEPLARSRGLRTRFHDVAFSLLVALVVCVGIRVVGLLLVTALLIVPAAAARNIARSAGGMFGWSALFGLVGGTSGLIGSFYAETAPGASIILVASLFFVVTLLIAPLRGRPSRLLFSS